MVVGAGILAVAAACGDAATPIPPNTPAATRAVTSTAASAPIPSPSPATTIAPLLTDLVRVDQVDLPVEPAVTPDERSKGLSGRASLAAGTGMLFIFDGESQLRFWMREMEISLDMVWIGADCRVVDISANIPPPEPGTSLDDLVRYSPDSLAQYVLEINGGEAEALGLVIGDPVMFLGGLEGLYGC